MNTTMTTRERIFELVKSLTQKAFLQYVALFTVTCLGFYLAIHYGTTWFDTDNGMKEFYQQFLLAAGLALAVCVLAFFTKML